LSIDAGASPDHLDPPTIDHSGNVSGSGVRDRDEKLVEANARSAVTRAWWWSSNVANAIQCENKSKWW
jgi:hypothetical protein